MKKIILTLIVFCGIFGAIGCTENWQAKKGGGTATYFVEQNQKFVNVTWKDNDLWILTRTRKEGELPEKFKFTEKSSFGLIEGTVEIIEK
jgi:hypothetical protein